MAKRDKPRKERPPGPFSFWVMRRRVVWFAALVLFGIGLDQGSKVIAQSSLAIAGEVPVQHNVNGELQTEVVLKHYGKEDVVLIPGFFHLKYVENEAAAFSLTEGIPKSLRLPGLIGFSLLAMLLMAAWYFLMKRPDGIVQTAVALICGGAMGNLVDRVRLGYVIDFLDFYLGFTGWRHWPTFNVADSFIVVGALLIVFRSFLPLTYAEDDEDELITEEPHPEMS